MNDSIALKLLEEMRLMRKSAERIEKKLDEQQRREQGGPGEVDELESVDEFKKRLDDNAREHQKKTKGERVRE